MATETFDPDVDFENAMLGLPAEQGFMPVSQGVMYMGENLPARGGEDAQNWAQAFARLQAASKARQVEQAVAAAASAKEQEANAVRQRLAQGIIGPTQATPPTLAPEEEESLRQAEAMAQQVMSTPGLPAQEYLRASKTLVDLPKQRQSLLSAKAKMMPKEPPLGQLASAARAYQGITAPPMGRIPIETADVGGQQVPGQWNPKTGRFMPVSGLRVPPSLTYGTNELTGEALAMTPGGHVLPNPQKATRQRQLEAEATTYRQAIRDLQKRMVGTPEEEAEMNGYRAKLAKVEEEQRQVAGGKASAPAAAAPGAKEKPLTKEIAAQFLKAAKGDKAKARELARNSGYTF